MTDAELMAPVRPITGTVGDDVMTVHRLEDGKPVCGTTGTVFEWQRSVTCSVCLPAEPEEQPH